jgi:hypothetical protein
MCRWYKIDVGNPTKGICISQAYQADENDASGGIASSVIPGRMVIGSNEACEKYDAKANYSRSQRLKEGM